MISIVLILISVSIISISYQVVYASLKHGSSVDHTSYIVIDPHSRKAGYAYGIREWNEFGPGTPGDYATGNSTTGHNFQCPLSHSFWHSNFCKGYDSAIDYENSDM